MPTAGSPGRPKGMRSLRGYPPVLPYPSPMNGGQRGLKQGRGNGGGRITPNVIAADFAQLYSPDNSEFRSHDRAWPSGD